MNLTTNWVEQICTQIILISYIVLLGTGVGKCDTKIIAVKINDAIYQDGLEEETWKKAKPLIVHDPIAKIDISIKVLYNEKELFMLVRFPDPDENRTHKSWVWNPSMKIYQMGADREDIFVVKWFIESDPKGLSLFAGKPHTADIWFWKANRTDPTGYADDKIQYLQVKPEKRATKITADNGTVFYLLRKGDHGDSAYTTKLISEYEGEKVPRFGYQVPTGSRADLRAKGVWQDGEWTIEFRRMLLTGHDDDLDFDVSKTYLLGVSRFEVAGRPPDSGSEQPLYGAGDIGQGIVLLFEN